MKRSFTLNGGGLNAHQSPSHDGRHDDHHPSQLFNHHDGKEQKMPVLWSFVVRFHACFVGADKCASGSQKYLDK